MTPEQIKARIGPDLFAQILEDLGATNVNRKSRRSTCIAHNGDNPEALHYDPKDGAVVWRCHTADHGGTAIDLVMEARGIDFAAAIDWLSLNYFGEHPGPGAKRQDRTEKSRTRYEIRHHSGVLVATHVRVDYSDGTKTFEWERDGTSGLKGLKTCDLPLYGSERVESWTPGAPVLLVEGEKAADVLRAHGYEAVGTVCGAKTTPAPSVLVVLASRDVVLWPDADDPGRVHMERIAPILRPLVSSLRVLTWSEIPKDDAADFFAREGTEDQLNRMRAEAPEWHPATPPQEPEDEFRILSLGACIDLVLPAPEVLLGPWLHDEETALVYASRGVGKTHFSLGGLAVAVAAGGSVFGWKAPKPRPVVYVDGELPLRKLQRRARLAWEMVAEPACDPRENLRILSAGYNRAAPNLAEEAGRAAVEKHLDGVELLILDAISTLCRGGIENEAESWQPIQDWLISLRARRITVITDHHAGKNGLQRGTSKREDAFDWIIKLAHPSDYAPKDGARFEVHFEKTRDFEGGRDLDPIEARIEPQDGKPVWTWKVLEAAVEEKILRMSRDGLSAREIGKEVRRDHSNVVRFLKKAKETGRLPFDGDWK